ncbi:hypothetical protein [Pseudomonas amygdali]|uniref:Uncharacterized protein n=3 Tax=Pseudomonas amygdali TaxID=47877 RepID=A0ABR5KRA4_PSEAV|nr:hypothetical protein [Pseudomonas amygdali]AXH59658.1 hypothetical protein PLA107_031015 [Pseudomonas amygdali pv. lachrymans str. M301315]KPC17085.1 Uncharacterized protein AC499_0287 [Pseudomonas amygdali pv. lachrymans]KPC18044.1 Uncharacterized protein AC499_1246 [Pseudomonas amygdali pv. lachrymans]RMT06405.1 hypothetical protein ALP54_03568 [Pseudomonas amygdali pv. lachrymans]
MYLHTAQDIETRFSEAHDLIVKSQVLQDTEMLSAGLQVMRAVREDCRRAEGGGALAQKGMGRIIGSIDFQACIKAYRSDKTKRHYFDMLLSNFQPAVRDITQHQHNKDINARLAQSLIRHDSGYGWNNYKLMTPEFDELLYHLGKLGSPVAFARVLDECLRRLHEQSYGASGKQNPLRVEVLTRLNGFKQFDALKLALPPEVLTVLANHPFQILAEHRKHRNKISGGHLTMGILQAWLDHCPGNEAVMEIVLELAGNSFYKMQDTRQLIWAEQLGLRIDAEKAGQKLKKFARGNEHATALHYLLASPQVASKTFSSILDQISNGFESAASIYALSPLLDSPDKNAAKEDLLIEKTILLTRYLFEKDRKTAIRIMGNKWLEPKHFMADPVLRDHLIGADLGL